MAVLAESPGGRRPERDRGGPGGPGRSAFSDNRGQPARGRRDHGGRTSSARPAGQGPDSGPQGRGGPRGPYPGPGPGDRPPRQDRGPHPRPQAAHLGHRPRLLHCPKMPLPAMSRCGRSVSSSSSGKRKSNRKPNRRRVPAATCRRVVTARPITVPPSAPIRRSMNPKPPNTASAAADGDRSARLPSN